MSQDLISRYKRSYLPSFPEEGLEDKYSEVQATRGRSSSVFAFAGLLVLSLVFTYIEYEIFGVNDKTPMFGFLFCSLVAFGNLALSFFSGNLLFHRIRMVGSGVLVMACILFAMATQEYTQYGYYLAEFALVMIWIGSLKTLRVLFGSIINLVAAVTFITTMIMIGVNTIWLPVAIALLLGAFSTASFIGYLTERGRRMLFLQTEIAKDMVNRQENWAFTLVDLDIAVSGILDFKEMISVLEKHLEAVIEFDSYVMTSLEGQGPKPVADKVMGELFEDDDRTLWSEDLLNKLTQTRQARVSAEHETVKGFLGIKKERFISYRLDVPVFNDSNLMGVISLRRANEPFDDLDMIAGVSIASQAMMIYRRTSKNAAMVLESAPPAAPAPAPTPKPAAAPVAAVSAETTASGPSPQVVEMRPKNAAVDDSPVTEDMITSMRTETQDMDVTDTNITREPDVTLAPKDVVKQFKRDEASTKKTITLMSRENADKVAVDRYRTAAVEGEPLSMLIVEVDGLSKIREQDGDQVAYKVFAAIVKYIFSKVEKEKDILGRYGQNGLSVLMPRVDMNAAEKFAEMLRQYVEGAQFKTAVGERHATLSIGVAAITDNTGDYGLMVKRADMALFVAKKNGRNCVKVRL